MRPEAPARYRASLFERLARGAPTATATRMILRNLERSPVRSGLSMLGIAFAVAVLVVGLAFRDVMTLLLEEQFDLSMRQDATVTFVQPRSREALFEVQRLPGVMDVEALRHTPVRLRHGARYRTLAIAGVPEAPRLSRIIDRTRGPLPVPPDGLVLSRMLGRLLDVGPGQRVRVEVLEGRRPVREVRVAALVDDSAGLQAYMRLDALGRLLQEGPVLTTVTLTLDPAESARFYREVKGIPAVAGVALRAVALQNFRETMAQNMNISILFNVGFAVVIAFGVVYNAARVSLSERARELASLRVLGFTRGEISSILLGELAVLTVSALPVGAGLGYALGEFIMSGFNNEVYRLTFVVSRSTIATAFLIVIAAAVVSALAVRRRLDSLDLVAVLKTRE
jgi:putative ABC transport system permease protein